MEDGPLRATLQPSRGPWNKAMVHGVHALETIIILADKRKAFCNADISLLRGGRGKDPGRVTQTPFSEEETRIIPMRPNLNPLGVRFRDPHFW